MKRRFATTYERVRPTRVQKSYKGIKKDRLFYSLETSDKRSSHITASKRVNLKTPGLRFNLKENIYTFSFKVSQNFIVYESAENRNLRAFF